MSPTPSRHICFVNLNPNSLLPPVSETWYDVDIPGFDRFNAALGIKHKLCLSSSLQVNINILYSEMKIMADYSDKRHSEVRDEDMYRKWGIVLENPRQTCMSKHRWMLGWPYCHWPRYNGLVYYLINLGDLSLSPIPTLSLLMTLLCKVINFAHPYTDGDGFLHVFPMRYKAWAGESLGNVVKYICIIN